MNRRLAVLSAHLQGASTAGGVPDFSMPSVEARLEKAQAAGVIKCDPVSLRLGAVVSGVNLKKELSPEQIQIVYDALLRYQVLVFHKDYAPENHDQQVRFTRELSTASPNLGPPTIGHTVYGHVDKYPEIFSVYQGEKNRPRDMEKYNASTALGSARPWTGFHCDITACVNPPCIGMLRGDTIPPYAGDTQFGNLVAAYEGLSEPIQQLVNSLRAEHLFNEGSGKSEYSAAIRARKMVSHHPMAILHPDTGKKVLFNSPVFLQKIVGVKPRESEQILDMLAEHSVRTEYTMRHKWTQGDLVLWDERCTTHRAPTDVFASGHDRQLFRTTLQGKIHMGVDGSQSTIIEGEPMLSVDEEFNNSPSKWEKNKETLRGSGNSWGQ